MKCKNFINILKCDKNNYLQEVKNLTSFEAIRDTSELEYKNIYLENVIKTDPF